QLTEKQVQEMTLEEKDKWWLENVYRGDMRQLTLRSGITGALLGSILSITNLYIGIKTGWTLGVGITSVILSYATFKFLSNLKIGDEMTVLENNTMQSIATSAGYMTMPLVSTLPAYMMITQTVIPQWQVYCWIVVLGILGALFAFPLKKRYINDEQLPFPEGYAAGVVLNNLHESDGEEGIKKAKILGAGAAVAAIIEFFKSEAVLAKMSLQFLTLPPHWDDIIYKFAAPKIGGIPLKDLTVSIDSSIVMMGTGMLMNMRSSFSLFLGAILNYCLLAPILMNQGIITGTGFKNITIWALWGGAAMMTTASLYSFLSSGNTFSSITELFNKKSGGAKTKKKDVLEHIELPKKVSYIGIPLLGIVVMIMGKSFFGIDYWLSAVAIPLVFIFCIMAVKSTGITAITPGSTLGKVTQVTYAMMAPGQVTTNLLAAGITSEVCLSASNLLMDIKPAYMLGGKPRHQAIGHIIGIFCGGLVAIPVFYLLFNGDISLFTSEKFPMPNATVYKAIADVLSNGLNSLHWTAQIAILVGAVFGVLCEIINKKTKGSFISPVPFGLAFVIPFSTCFEMFLGTLLFWLMNRKAEEKRSPGFQLLLENKETLGAGIIAGGSIIGIALLIAETSL
ncbi:MAG: OPT family oligopeptide transporter, partial [Pseudomonadota bacterium]